MTLRPRPGSKGTSRARAWDDSDRRSTLLNVGFGLAIVASLLLLVIAWGVSWYSDHWAAAATVNGQSVSKDAYARAVDINNFRADYQKSRIRTLLSANHIRPSDAETRTAIIDQRVAQIDTLTLEQLVDGMIQADLATKQSVGVTDADVDAKIKDEATTPELRHAWLIAVTPEIKTGETVATDEAKAAAKAKADQALVDLKAGKAWEEVAKAVSTDTTKDQGGDLGFIDKDSSLESGYLAALQAAAVNTPTDVLEGSDGTYRIGRVTEVIAAAEDTSYLTKVTDAGISLEDFRAAIRRDVTRTKLNEAVLAPYLVPGAQREVAQIKLEASASETGPKAVKTRHILYSPNDDPNAASTLAADDPAWAKAKADADAAYAKIKADPSLFDSIARAESDEGAAKTSGGKLPYFSQSDSIDQAFADAIFADGLVAGQLLAPVKSSFGWHVIQILYFPPTADFAKSLKADLDSGKVTFADAARDYSDATSSSKGGDIGWVAKGQLSADLEKAIFAAPVGKVSDPVLVGTTGTYLLHVSKEETRELSSDQKATIEATVFADWYAAKKADYTVTRDSSITGATAG